ncbi:MAG: geranylgeranyl reductase family protein [Cyanobacteriota bacterium]|nr:geranylgeranyl reductase family protein [Cyanobacteriota bacterium]
MYDCIIVGAGPAGGAAAYHLAKQGYSVLILEKESLPRYRPSGGAVSPAIAQWFDFDLSPIVSVKVDRVCYTLKNSDPVEVELETAEPMWVVKRDTFDRFLVQQAQDKGAELRDRTTVTGIQFKGDSWQVNTNGEALVGRYLVGADGPVGSMARWLKLKPAKARSAAALEVPTSNPEPSIGFEMGLVKNGFIWKFPKADGYSLGAATMLGGDSKKLSSTLADYAKKSGLDVSAATPYEHSVTLWDGDRTLHAQNALLAGDAAGVADPFTAEGVRPAIYTGVKAAEAISQALNGEEKALAEYTKTIKETWGSEMVWAGRLAQAFYRFPKIGYKVGVKQPAATQLMLKILCGEDQYSRLVGRATKRLTAGLFKG